MNKCRKCEFNDLVLVPVKSRVASRGDLGVQAIVHLKAECRTLYNFFFLSFFSETMTSLWTNITANQE